MKLRLLPVSLSVVISATVLFGGYFVYQSVAMENPLASVVNNTPGVLQLVDTKISSTETTIELKLKPGASLRQIYNQIQKGGASVIGEKQLKLKVDSDSSDSLDAWWSSALFDVAQAMETKKYSQIPATLQARAADSNLKVSTEMDDKYVYVTMSDGTQSKYVMLPRTPDKMGVWPNE
ncbi:hypothetical protein ACHHV8_19755 [Paenibacillus sp. TAB 01]|uniref:hypothetical protein n=1 Tax=Paenibacillus sp. TAB 01 TaxID=3368988 RepID=UPI003751EADC